MARLPPGSNGKPLIEVRCREPKRTRQVPRGYKHRYDIEAPSRLYGGMARILRLLRNPDVLIGLKTIARGSGRNAHSGNSGRLRAVVREAFLHCFVITSLPVAS